jgi:signal transduction histidine kinase
MRRGVADFLLRVPLALKLAGANAFIVVTVWLVVFLSQHPRTGSWPVLVMLAGALAAGLAANLVIVLVALRPIRDLEAAADRVAQGDLATHVSVSPLADRAVRQLTATLNGLLDTLGRDRERMRGLTREMIRTGEIERARLARQLHESLAQSLAAIMYRVSAAERDLGATSPEPNLSAAREIAARTIDETRRLSGSVYPQVLDDFGLLAGLKALARASSSEDVAVSVRVHGCRAESVAELPLEAAAALYRVAEEALRNALRHGAPSVVEIEVGCADDAVVLNVVDNGTGFDAGNLAVRHMGTGLFVMRERVALLHGRCDVESAPGDGTAVRVRLPLRRDILPSPWRA